MPIYPIFLFFFLTHGLYSTECNSQAWLKDIALEKKEYEIDICSSLWGGWCCLNLFLYRFLFSLSFIAMLNIRRLISALKSIDLNYRCSYFVRDCRQINAANRVMETQKTLTVRLQKKTKTNKLKKENLILQKNNLVRYML